MTRTKVYLILQAIACALLAAALAASAISIYLEGAARKEAHPLEPIYTPEIVTEKIAPLTPLFFVSIGLTAAGLVLGIKEEKKGPGLLSAPKPVKRVPYTAAVQTVLVIAALAMIVAGALNGSAWDVLVKAINICTECIGLG